MARGKITKSDLISNDVKKGLQELRNEIDLTVKSFKQLKTEAKAINKEIKGAKTFNDVSDKAKKASTNVKKLTKEEQRLQKATKELNFQLSKEGKELAKVQQKTAAARKANRDYAKSQDTAKKNTNTFGKALGSFAFKFNALGNIAANVASKITQFAKKIITEGVRGVVSFDAAITNVKAVAGATDEQFEKLRQSAIALGGATKFTATQVAELQKEYAKLGFTTEDIIALQDSTLQLATATGAELAPAAKVVGGALRAFGKSTKEAQSVAATLAIATTKSALAFEDYETILSTVAPVARAYNFSLEDTVALLGQLKNANFDASSASTATRNILLNLADSNGDLAKALGGGVNTLEDMVAGLVQLREEGVDLATTLDLTDKRSVAAFNTFLIGAENALVLKDEISGVNEELDEMVNTQLGSLENKVTLLSSAWQGLIQQISDTNDVTKASKQGVSGLTKVVQDFTAVSELNEDMGAFAKVLKIVNPLLLFQIDKYGFLTKSVTKTKEETEELTKVLQEGGLDEYAVDLGALRVAHDNLNKETKESVPILQDINSQIKTLQGLRMAATTKEQVRAYTEEIRVLQDRSSELTTAIDKEKELKQIRTDTLIAIRQAIGLRESFSDKGIGDDDFFASMELSDSDVNKAVENAEELANGLNVIAEDLGKSQQNRRDDELKKDKEHQKAKFDILKSFGTAGFDFINALNARSQENQAFQTNQELIDLESKFKNELITADQYEAQRIEIERKGQEESLKLRRRAAVIDKSQALFNIGLNTAVAISRVTAQTGVLAPATIPLIVALGLAQAAAVIASPIPQFAKGTDSSPEGLAVVGEKGSELMIDKKGNIGLSPDKASLAYLEKGTQIIPSDITQSLLAHKALSSSYDGQTDTLLKRNNALLERIAKKPVSSSTMTSSGILTAVHRGNTTLKKLDKYFK